MKILITGAHGFIGQYAVKLLGENHEVIDSARSSATCILDLSDTKSITKALQEHQPEVIINCAGVVENSDKAALNETYTKNLLEAILASGAKPKSILILGSAAEYGVVAQEDLPIREDSTLAATSPYGLGKLREVQTALEFKAKHGLPITVARIFNPVGVNMPSRMLVPGVIAQIQAIREGNKDVIEVSRLDAIRDYISVEDVIYAFDKLITAEPEHDVYNVGSGIATSNGELVKLIIEQSKVLPAPKVVETKPEPEPIMAAQADISRLKNEFGWSPKRTLAESIEGIVSATEEARV